MLGKLSKMKIKAVDEDLTYIALVNPEQYKITHQIVYDSACQIPGTSGKEPKYSHTTPANLQFDFFFDSTGVIPKPLEGTAGALSGIPILGTIASTRLGRKKEKGYDILDEIEAFKTIVLNYDGKKHEPRTVQLIWGTLCFDAKLTNLEFNYKLFNPDGSPMRVVATASFIGTVENDLRLALENSNSPDLTHIRKVKEGDTLPLMTYKIYGDSSYYLEVAKVNKLVNFRNLTPGDEIFFPPLNKSK